MLSVLFSCCCEKVVLRLKHTCSERRTVRHTGSERHAVSACICESERRTVSACICESERRTVSVSESERTTHIDRETERQRIRETERQRDRETENQRISMRTNLEKVTEKQ